VEGEYRFVWTYQKKNKHEDEGGESKGGGQGKKLSKRGKENIQGSQKRQERS